MNNTEELKNRYYRISLSGVGGEFVYGKITKAQYDFWSKRKVEELETHLLDPDSENSDNPISDQDSPLFLGEYYEQDGVFHEWGALSSERIEIYRMAGPEYNSKVIEYVFEDEIEKFISKYGCKVNQ